MTADQSGTDARAEGLLRWLNEAETRVAAALELHEQTRFCLAHHQQHECPEPGGYTWRCYTCARTRVDGCATWRALTGKAHPGVTDD